MLTTQPPEGTQSEASVRTVSYRVPSTMYMQLYTIFERVIISFG